MNRKKQYLLNGFKNGFSVGYQGPYDRKDPSDNIILRKDIGTPKDLWEKDDKRGESKKIRLTISTSALPNFCAVTDRFGSQGWETKADLFFICHLI